MRAQPTTPGEELRHLFMGYRVSQAIYATTKLGIADELASGPRSVDELAGATGAHAPSLFRVLRLLASEGVFAETEDGRFTLTPMAEALRRDVPGSLWPAVLYNGSDTMWRSWGQLEHSVRTGQPAFDHVHGVAFFEYFRRHPDEWLLFDQLMATQTAPVTGAIAAAYDFSQTQTIVDVGGGNGELAIGLLTIFPGLRAIVFDQPAVATRARKAFEAAGFSDRGTAVGGDFFADPLPSGDAYLLKYILHDWDDERCIAILKACRHAVATAGRLLVVELLVPPGNGPSSAKSQDVNMLANLGGKERSEAEYRSLFAASGFKLTQTITALGELHVIEGVPV